MANNKHTVVENELNAILNNSYDGIIITDKLGNHLRVSKSVESLTGLNIDELLSKSAKELQTEGAISKSITNNVIKLRKRVSIEQYYPRSGKKLLITGSPLFDCYNQIDKVIINLRDVTELCQIKERLSKSLNELEKLQSDNTLLITNDEQMRQVYRFVCNVANLDASIFITGETGVGKSEIVKLVQEKSKRKDTPLIEINCGAIPPNLLESELFGYEKGAFTGATARKIGLFEMANSGTVFLDEVTTLPLDLQVKLLKVLDNNKIFRLGGTKEIHLDIRFIAATNQNVKQLVNDGKFREDLYYRLNVLPLHIPPLRERTSDILVFIKYFLDHYNNKYNVKKHISDDALGILTAYNWPGNIRELKNCIERLVILVDQAEIGSKHLTAYTDTDCSNSSNNKYENHIDLKNYISLKKAKEVTEKDLIQRALKQFGSTRKAAKILCVDHSTIVRKLKKYNIT